jgi:hypothetical protein
MKASKPIRALAVLSLLSAMFLASGARAHEGEMRAGFDGIRGGGMVQMGPDARPYVPHYRGGLGDQVDQRQATQWERIRYGIRTGELTRGEAARLMAEQREIERLQRLYLADGRLDRGERRHLIAELDDASRHIWRQSHDAQDRDRRPW